MKIDIEERMLHFKQPAGTSRGIYTERRIWLVKVIDGERVGIGECAPLPNLSCDDLPDYSEELRVKSEEFAAAIQKGDEAIAAFFETLRDYPSMLFGMETALDGLKTSIVPSQKERAGGEAISIPTNGLVWMGSYDEMEQRIEQKLKQGFHCIKLKIGAIDFDAELELLKKIRKRFGPREIELRVDANGAFAYDEALYKLELLSQYALHSIEQPIKAKQWANMSELCRESPLRIALDEELIGVNDPEQKRQMLNIIRPAYIVLKPSLHGGMMGVREWVEIANDMGIGSWITSALESNVGLYAIARLAYDIYGPNIRMPQGLGTGLLFTDNIPMPLEMRGDRLWISTNS